MEYEVDDFFNEINEIAPPKQVASKQETVWKQCHDELTGYTYYWNTETDEVTWQTPSCFKSASKKDTSSPKDPPQPPQKLKPNLYVPPKTPVQQLGAVKIYSIGECSQQTYKISDSGGGDKKKKKTKTAKDKESVLKKFLGRDSESEDEKIELITSYGGDTDSESEEPPSKKNKHDPQDSDHNEDDDGDLDILSQIKRAQALKDMSDSKKDVSDSKKPKTVVKEDNLHKPSKKVPGLKLVVGYSDSEEDEPNELTVVSKPTFVKPESHSTLFPITKPIDIKDFALPETETEEKVPNQADVIDAKVFQRKKRIGVALVNTGKKKEDLVDGEGERKGLDFNTGESQPSQPNSNIYPGFAKGGVMFVKTDVLQSSLPSETAVVKVEKKDEEELVNKKELEDMYQTLKEKLAFLNVGAEVVSPVHTMIIQSEILFLAMNEGGLKLSYLQKWLQNTCSELIKLEKEATPEGWLLQWDRQNKRYYYENVLTGASQWEYPVEPEDLPPQLPANKPRSPPPPPPPNDDDAMDICTTPPPPEDPQEVARASPPPPPPAPPVISCPSPPPSPPPPPIISVLEGGEKKPPLPPPPPPDTPYPGEILAHKKDMIEQQQPLPPGVDIPPPPPGEPPEPSESQPTKTPGDPLKSALNSFYSDIAALSSDLTAPPSTAEEKPAENLNSDQTSEVVKKKKKTKVKLAAGITLKKKGVTQLVEKWNTLQNNYD